MSAATTPPDVSPAIALASPKGATLRVVRGEKVTCLAVSLPRGAHFKTVVGYDLSEVGRDQLLTALLDWRYTADELPDDDTRVICALDSKHTDELEFGHHGDGQWWGDDHASLGIVYAWAHIPALPPKKGGAS